MSVKRPSSEVISKARAYCARQERAQQEVRDKLYGWGAHKAEVETTISRLISEGFLNEARFAEHFAVSKFRQKGWGRRKIEQALKLKRVSDPCIHMALKGIDDKEYNERLEQALAKRADRLNEPDAFVKRQKLLRYFIGKGYPTEMIELTLDRTAE